MAEEQLLASIKADISSLRREVGEATRLIQDLGDKTHATNKRMELSFLSLNQAVQMFGVSLSAAGLVAFIKQVTDASTRLNTLTIAFKTITGSVAGATAELSFLRDVSERLGINFVTLAEGFRGMAAAAKGTQIEGAGVRTIFTAVSEASRVMGLGTEQTGRLMVGLTQILGKGVVQMEEWRQQIGEALPQANQTLARAMGVSTAALSAMIEAGQIGLPELVKWAELLHKDVAGGVDEASKTFVAATARMENALFAFLAAIGDLITKNPETIAALNKLAKGIQETADTISQNMKFYQDWLSWWFNLNSQVSALLNKFNPLAMGLKLLQEVVVTGAAVPGLLPAPVPGEMEGLEGSRGRPAGRVPGMGAGLGARLGQVQNLKLNETVEILKDIKTVEEALLTGRIGATKANIDQIEILNQKWLSLQKQLREIRDPQFEERQREAEKADREKQRLRETEVQTRFAHEKQQLTEVADQYVKLTRDVSAYDELIQTIQARLPVYLAELKKSGATPVELLKEQTKWQQDLAQLEETAMEKSREFIMERGRLQMQATEDDRKAQETRANAALAAEEKAHAAVQNRLADEFKIRATSIETSSELIEASDAYLRTVTDNANQQLLMYEEQFEKTFLTEEQFTEKRKALAEGLANTQRELELGVARLREREQDRAIKEQERALEKQAREWKKFGEKVSDALSDTIFDVLTGKIDGIKDLFEEVKEAFLRMLSDMAAQAITRQIVMPIMMQVLGAPPGMGGPGAPGGTGGAMGALGTGQQAVMLISTSAGTQQFQNFMAGQPSNLQGPTPSGVPMGWTGGGVAQGAAGAALGAAGGAAAGVSTGMMLQSINTELLGLPRDNSAAGRGSRALAGAGGGALGGALIGNALVPGIGAAVGAIAGAIIGGLVGGLTKVATVPFLQFKAVDLMVGMQDEALRLVENNIVAAGKGLPGSMADVSDRMETGLAQAFQPVFDFLNTTSPRIRAGVVAPMNQFADDLESMLEGPAYAVAKKQGKEFVEKFLGEEIPRLVGETFGPLIKALEQVQPLVEGYRTAITTLRQQQERLLGSLSAQRVALQETLMTPAQLFERRRSELGSLLGRFRGAGGAEQLQLVPEIQALIGEVMQRGQAAEVLGTDREALFSLQRELIGYVDELTAVSTQVLDTQMSQAQHQIDVLEESLLHLESVDTAAAASRLLLQDLNTFLQTAFQGQFQGGGMIPHTGFAMVHQGEYVLPSGPISVNLTVHSAAPHSAGLTADIERMVITKVIPVLKQRQRLGQY